MNKNSTIHFLTLFMIFLGCTQSRVSKLEHASLSSIADQDVIDYFTALGADLERVM